ncbi:MAG: thioesterase [Burkholderia contaminans]|uniref:Thioesterase n=1 Tax=Burkholderia contaminans TaxID=488447 RepID=A0AAP4R1L6_9BURK|nr:MULTISPECIES: thioesterase [Burkholderia]MBD1414214.1 thioesterase [Burkholderia contaminans]MBH9666917.1 thioesterase [Burkholderia contaminans]MBH9673536.1 thioesterase [Burkholderia contaminans]MBH9703579.1 thioesterase [Burkholderia contaminans]MBH9719963.1 thioesterase [Burkholderia contaminans]
MRNDAKRAASVAMRNRTVRCAGAVRQVAIGLGVAFAMSNAVAAGHAASEGIVRFTGALVDLYDVTLDAPSGVAVEGREVANGGAAATLRFDAHGRRLPGAHVALLGPDGAPFSPDVAARVRATWRDAHDDRSVPLASGRTYRVGPYGGVMSLAADEATGAEAPVVIRIRHP